MRFCPVCFQRARGWGYSPRMVRRVGEDVWFCGRRCRDYWESNGMTDWLPIEDEMLLECGQAGGEYLESLGKSDLAALSKEE